MFCFFSLNVHVVTSDHPGVGKSLVVQRLAEQVSNLQNNQLVTEMIKDQAEEPPPLCVTIPFHDKRARVADVVGFFLPHALHSDIPLSRIFHMDRSATVIFFPRMSYYSVTTSNKTLSKYFSFITNLPVTFQC